jgi:N6-L-threonylcarbamoyladenine synthase
MEGHIYASLVEEKKKNHYTLTQPAYPTLALLISGGHTEIIFSPIPGKYQKVGETLDDAAGEAFDKAARSMGLEYPGGPKISKLAESARKRGAVTPEHLRLPRPMINAKNLDFSFSGLKTAVLYATQKNEINSELREVFCMEFENAVTDVIVKKLETAVFLYNTKSMIVGGGVSANNHIREAITNICRRDDVDLYLPKREMSTDNALMIAIIAMVKINNNTGQDSNQNLAANGNLSLDQK